MNKLKSFCTKSAGVFLILCFLSFVTWAIGSILNPIIATTFLSLGFGTLWIAIVFFSIAVIINIIIGSKDDSKGNIK